VGLFIQSHLFYDSGAWSHNHTCSMIFMPSSSSHLMDCQMGPCHNHKITHNLTLAGSCFTCC